MSRQVPVTISSESDSPIAITITSASESAQTIPSDQNPDVALVSEIITVHEEEDDQRSDTIQHVDSSSDDEGLGFLEAKLATAYARRQMQEALSRASCEGTTCARIELVRAFRSDRPILAFRTLGDLVRAPAGSAGPAGPAALSGL